MGSLTVYGNVIETNYLFTLWVFLKLGGILQIMVNFSWMGSSYSFLAVQQWCKLFMATNIWWNMVVVIHNSRITRHLGHNNTVYCEIFSR